MTSVNSHFSKSQYLRSLSDIPGKMTFKESDALSPGNNFTTFTTPWCEVGLGICYDIRFAQLAQVYAEKQCKLLVYPGAFNMTTGRWWWKTLGMGSLLVNLVSCRSSSLGVAGPGQSSGQPAVCSHTFPCQGHRGHVRSLGSLLHHRALGGRLGQGRGGGGHHHG